MATEGAINVILILSVMVGAVLVTAAFLRGFPVVGSAVFQDDTKDRYASMDGLRGILALCVFIDHWILAPLNHCLGPLALGRFGSWSSQSTRFAPPPSITAWSRHARSTSQSINLPGVIAATVQFTGKRNTCGTRRL